jgi:DNA-binding NtrC family response regulator
MAISDYKLLTGYFGNIGIGKMPFPKYRKTETPRFAVNQSGQILSPEEIQSSIDNVLCCPGLHPILEELGPIIDSDIVLLILGETGVGKGYMAKCVHALSPQAAAPFVPVNCAGNSEGRDNAELFGWEKSAFPGAYHSNPGYFRIAGDGTIFLDEIGKSDISFQKRLLKVIDDREVWPVGASVPYDIKCRILAGANENLEQCVENGTFLEDLLYRINAEEVTIPPLRKRKKDIPVLVKNIIRERASKQCITPPDITTDAMQFLIMQKWPGNVRQLWNVVSTAVLRSNGDTITSDLIRKRLQTSDSKSISLAKTIAGIEREIIEATLQATPKNTVAAKVLGISLSTLRDKISKYGLKSPSKTVRNTGELSPRNE